MTKFSEEQKNCIEWVDGPLLVLGTPGSGKTTVIVNRIRYLIDQVGIDPSSILVITFTRAAAESMRLRLQGLSGGLRENVHMSTFHAFFYWIVRTGYKTNFEVLEEDKKRAVIRKFLASVNREIYDNEEAVSSFINQLGVVQSDMIELSDYYSYDMPTEVFVKTAERYQDYKTKNNYIDFDDMVTMCYKLLKERPDIVSRLQEMFPYIMVDEFQDTNRIQYEILKMIVKPLNNLFAVGDDDQSIYSFRGARPDIMLSFKKEFEGAEVKELSLNFRCPSEITKVSSSLIKANKKRYQKNLASAAEGKGEISFFHPDTYEKELDLIIQNIRQEIKNGVDLKQIAVLFRTNSSPRRLIYKLKAVNIPFHMRDQVPDIFSHFAVKPILDYIAFAMGDNSRERFLKIMNVPVRYISRSLLESPEIDWNRLMQLAAGKQYLHQAILKMKGDLRRIAKLNPYAGINYIRQVVGYDRYLKDYAEEKAIDYNELLDVLDEFQGLAQEATTYPEFLALKEKYQEVAKIKYKKDEPGIELMTFHSAKGLEFEYVHLMDLVEGMVPHKKSKTPSEMEEERRMFYVAVTRASKNLSLYAPETMGEHDTKTSRFIKEMGIPVSDI